VIAEESLTAPNGGSARRDQVQDRSLAGSMCGLGWSVR
jgi:hypothetical protein